VTPCRKFVSGILSIGASVRREARTIADQMIHEESRTIMRRIAMDYDHLAKLAEVQLIQEATERKT
jgi:hypothetical protein